jgi:hypothetical protein
MAALPSRPAPLPPADLVVEALRAAPLDDESYTDEERSRVEEGRAAAKRGEVVSTAELKRRLGL